MNEVLEFDPGIMERIAVAPLPTKKTLKARKNVFVQLWRLIGINIRMLKVIAASHHR
ncbi:MAG: hypothetical protein FWG08_01375 [Propionibacteriaceae bacterium]|jgi:hypothetical protein|nr:hypothetical protein [Propionibacteriaceae bacterium]